MVIKELDDELARVVSTYEGEGHVAAFDRSLRRIVRSAFSTSSYALWTRLRMT